MDKKDLEDFVNNVENKTNYALEDTLLDSEVKIDDVRSFNYDDIVKNSNKARMSKLPWLVTIFLILIIAIIVGTMFLKRNPQTVFTMAVDKIFTYVIDNISDTNYDISKGNIKANFNMSGEENKELFDEISKLNFDIDYVVDSANDLSHFKISSTYLDDDFIDLDVYSDKKAIYVYSEDIYDSYLKSDNLGSFNKISLKDVRNIFDGVNQAFDRVATSEKITGKSKTLDVYNKTLKVYETTLVIDKSNYERVAETFVNTLKSNKELVSSLAKIKNSSSGDIKKSLNRFLLNLKVIFKENKKTEVKLYTDRESNDFIKGEITGKLGHLSFIKKDDGVDFVIFDAKEKEQISGNVTLETNDKKTDYEFKVDIKMQRDNKVIYSGKGDIKITNKKASSFGSMKVDKAISIDDLTDLEKFAIYTKVFTNPKFNVFLKFIK